MKHANTVMSALGTTILEIMSRMAADLGAVNLGQGYPEGLEPRAVLDHLAKIALNGPHQYPSMMGTPALRQALARHEKCIWSADVDPMTQVMVTSGATEALAAAILALIDPGDEVVVFEPLYDSYLPIIRRGGGIPKPVRLSPPDWALPRAEIAAAFSPKTKLVILNSPTNPSGKVFSADEMAFLADLAQRHDVYVLCDEVYEHLTYDDRLHIPMMSLPGMAERTIKIGSAGKIFSLTGWKVGWVIAAPTTLSVIAKSHQFLTFTTPPLLQEAVAWGLDQQQDYYTSLPPILAKRRDRLANGLDRLGFKVARASGSYFLTADYTPLDATRDDEAFCRRMVQEARVAAIPVSAFYSDGAATGFIRFCFAKTDEMIDQALARLGEWVSP
jgi:aspartate/methionine/tyrosine aminotransferase